MAEIAIRCLQCRPPQDIDLESLEQHCLAHGRVGRGGEKFTSLMPSTPISIIPSPFKKHGPRPREPVTPAQILMTPEERAWSSPK